MDILKKGSMPQIASNSNVRYIMKKT